MPKLESIDRVTASRRGGNLMQGKKLGGRYQIISHLGGGGFGTTFLAEDRHLPGNPQCVVKHLKPKTADNPLALQAARRLFNREAEVLYQLGNHDRIPRLFAHFEEEQEFYLVQEFVEGHELKQELSGVQQLNEHQVIVLLREILEILVFVHQQNVIHRDIKPSNLIRRRLDGKLILIDFGAVKQFGSQVINSEGETSLTIAVGSPGYMPNEQIAGKPRFSSDIFAVGIIGIQAITGLNPKQFPEDPRTCEIVWRNFVKVSSEFADILDKMVRYDCRQRYQSADETLLALNSVPTTAFAAKIEIPLEEPNSDIEVLPTETLFPPDDMPSERGIDYSRLRDLLATGNWQEADRETKFVILKAVGREEEGRLIVEDIEKLPSLDLCTIDNLWEKYSNGRFGFSVQKRIWENIGGRKDATRDVDYQTWRSFGEQVGWRVNGSWLVSDRLNFTLNAPFGHLPALPNRRWWGLNYHLISHRLGSFGLDDSTKTSSNIKQENLIDDLCSERGVDYTQLRDLLAVGNWQEADRETEIIMLRICDREQIGFFKVEDLQKFPCRDLQTIDKLWSYYSNGCFGFSIQKNIYDNLVEKQYFQPEIWKNFTERVGWRINGQRISYSNLNFSSNAPKGHLPGWFCEGRDIALILYRRIKDCNIANPVSSKNIISVKS